MYGHGMTELLILFFHRHGTAGQGFTAFIVLCGIKCLFHLPDSPGQIDCRGSGLLQYLTCRVEGMAEGFSG